MTFYFSVYSGLRGAYLDSESPAVVSAESLPELRSYLESRAADLRSGEAIGLNKKAVAALAREAWVSANSARPSGLPFVAGFRWSHNDSGSRPYGLFCGPASESEYMEANGIVKIDAPAYWASALINGDESGMEESEVSEMEAWLKAEDLTEADCVDCGEESGFGQFYFRVQGRNLGCDLVGYTFHKPQADC